MPETTRRAVLAGSAALLAGTALSAVAATPAGASRRSGPKPTVVLVHGAFADAAGWTEVTRRLQRAGYPVLAPANPLRGVPSDTAYLAEFLGTIDGPIVLVGHSYGGMIITNAATDNADVKALVYVAAFAPDEGDTLEGLQTKYPGSKLGMEALDFRPYTQPDGSMSYDGYVKAAAFREVFAGDLPESVTAVMAATQRPADVHTLQEPSGRPAWRTVPTWYLVARNDNLIPAAAQRFMAKRAQARTVEIGASHVAMISEPAATADLIARAAASVR
ncbi:alpha/beta fold hydrolase [Asanoa iriomotensis]|uniref:Alpha/beta hydrolase n=1 Tax=Asanoa iriomotensis TaxID=234613 RepID=A0ABQ4CD89_9ACTN|nr:alpha/beta hydrolase [Asanoa iriomotensis]GIF60739.1 alpha/beta hydrolase [Asanoa iriomotensis]